MTKIGDLGLANTFPPLYIKHARPVTHPANIQIFQYDMVFYLGNLEMNFIGTEAMKRSNENSVIVGILSFYNPPPQIEPRIYAPACNIPTMVELNRKWYCTWTSINAVFSLMLCYMPHFSQGSFQFCRAKVSDTPQIRYAIYAPEHTF